MSIVKILESHPQRLSDVVPLARAIAEATTCAAVCSGCADACLAETGRDQLVKCIQLNLDCADICAALVHVGMRRRESGSMEIRALLDVCGSFCGDCAEECERHASVHRHCMVCAEICRKCEAACRDAMARL